MGNRSPRAARFYGQGRPAFGVVDVGRFGSNAGANRGPAKKVSGPCHYCDKEGHWKNECLKKKADEARRRFKKEQEGGQTAFTALSEGRKAVNDWIIDSGERFPSEARKALKVW